MASTDARPVPRKNTAYRVYFSILDADGDPVSGAASLDSEVSIDGGNFADCTNEATEIQSTGHYYLDLTSGEMNGDAVVVQVKNGTAGAKTTSIFFYPEEAGDFRADVTHFGGSAGTFASGRPEVNVSHWLGTAAQGASGRPQVDVELIEGADPTDTIRDAVVDDATRIDASALNTLSGHDPGETIMGATDLGTGAGLTSLATAAELAKVPKSDSNVGWNATARAQIQQEGEDALAAYDPPTKAELDAAVAPLALEATVADVEGKVDDLEGRLGTPSDLGSGATVAANLVDIEGQTDDIGAAGAGLTALATAAELAKVPKSDSTVGWNATARAQIQQEAEDALAAYDPPTHAELTSGLAAADDAVLVQVALVKAKTDNLPSDPADQSAVEAAITAALETAVADSVPADGSRPTIKQALYMLTQFMCERSVSGTTLTVKKPDGSTTLMTFTLNDATNPTSITRS